MGELGRLNAFALAELGNGIEHDTKHDDADHRNDVGDEHMQIKLHPRDLRDRPLQVQPPLRLGSAGRRPNRDSTG